MSSEILECDPLVVLYEYYKQNKDRDDYLKELSFGWSYQPVGFAVIIDSSGELVDVKDIRKTGGTEKYPKKVGVDTPLPMKPIRSSMDASYLSDTSEYMFGLTVEGDSVTATKKGAEYREAFIKRWQELEKLAPECEEIKSVLSFYQRYTPEELAERDDLCYALKNSKGIVFRLFSGANLHDIPVIKEATSKCIERRYDGNSRCICRFSGEEDAVSRTWQPWIGGGSNSKMPTHYKPLSARRYGYVGGDNALVGVRSEWALCMAFQSLYRHSVELGDKNHKTIYLCWTEGGKQPKSIRGLLSAAECKDVYNPRPGENPDCYVMGVSFVGRRSIYFKSCLRGKLSDFDKHILSFQSILYDYGVDMSRFGVRDLVRALNDDRSANEDGYADGYLKDDRIHYECGDELIDRLFQGKPLSERLVRQSIVQFRKFMYRRFDMTSYQIRYVRSLITYGLWKSRFLESEERKMKRGETMENDNKVMCEKDACWILGCLMACVHRAQEQSVHKGKRKGNVFSRLIGLAERDPRAALRQLETWYMTKYRAWKNVNDRWWELIPLVSRLDEVLPSKPSLWEKVSITHGFIEQLCAFYNDSKEEQEPEQEKEQTDE